MNTVNIKINGYDYTMKHGITILDASFETLKFQREYLQQSIPTLYYLCLLNTYPSPRKIAASLMPSSQ